MNRPRGPRDEGAVLVLAVLFLVIVGVIGGAVASLASTNLADTSALGNDQTESYAAQSAVQVAIDALRAKTAIANTPGYNNVACPTLSMPAGGAGTGSPAITVVCGVGSAPLLYERTIVFAACASASNCLTSVGFVPKPGTAAIVVATTVFHDLAHGCSGPNPSSCFVPGTAVDVTGYDIRKADG